jgi:hypothetical protein
MRFAACGPAHALSSFRDSSDNFATFTAMRRAVA